MIINNLWFRTICRSNFGKISGQYSQQSTFTWNSQQIQRIQIKLEIYYLFIHNVKKQVANKCFRSESNKNSSAASKSFKQIIGKFQYCIIIMNIPTEFICYPAFSPQPNCSYFQTYWFIDNPPQIIYHDPPQVPERHPSIPAIDFYELFKEKLIKRKPTFTKKVWKKEEDDLLLTLYAQNCSWQHISQKILRTNADICKRRFIRLSQKQPKWSKQEDALIKQMKDTENRSWVEISKAIKNHNLKQIRERYENYLRDGICLDEWSVDEDIKIIEYVRKVGKKWKNLSSNMPERTEIQLKNRYYGTLYLIEQETQKELRNLSQWQQNH